MVMTEADRTRRLSMALTMLQGSADNTIAYEFLNLYLRYNKKILGDLKIEAAYQVCKRKDALVLKLQKQPSFQDRNYLRCPEYAVLYTTLWNAGIGMSSSRFKRNISDWNLETLVISKHQPFVVHESTDPVWVPLASQPANDLPEDVEIIGPDAPAVKPQA
jgi:hypothetical protein